MPRGIIVVHRGAANLSYKKEDINSGQYLKTEETTISKGLFSLFSSRQSFPLFSKAINM